jgi:cytochrome oxidase assembly protein ShyY1
VREVLRQRRWWGFSLFVLAMLALCVVLANWQWNRYQQRSAENDRLDAALSAPAQPVDELLVAGPVGDAADLPAELEWRTATASGEFDAEGEVAVRRRPLEGRAGFWIVTPLVTESGVLLVNRGWAPAGRDATAAPEVPAPPVGPVTVTGRLRAAETTQQSQPPPDGQAWAADPDTLVPPGAGDRYEAYLELRESVPDSAEGLTLLSDPGHRGLNNLVYAVQWLIFAAVGAIGWWRLIRQESRREPEEPGGVDTQDAGTDAGLSPDTRPAG